MLLSFDLDFSFLESSPKEIIRDIDKDLSIRMMIAALPRIERFWQQCKHQTMEKLLNKVWYSFMMEYCCSQ